MIAQKAPKQNIFIKKCTYLFTCYQIGAKILSVERRKEDAIEVISTT